MKIAFSTHSVTEYPQSGWGQIRPEKTRAQVFDWVKETGFQGVEIADSWTDLYEPPKGYLEDIRAQLDQRGLPVVALNCLRKSLCHPTRGQENEDMLYRALEAAATLGCKIVSISLSQPTERLGGSATRGRKHSPGSSLEATEEDYRVSAERLRKLARKAAGMGRELSIELHHCSIADTSAGVLKVIEMTGEPNVGANPDLVNEYGAYAQPRESWQQALANLVGRMNLWHVKNTQRIYIPELEIAEFIEAPLPVGDIDYRWALVFAAEHGYTGWVSIEGAGPIDPFTKSAWGKRYLDECLEAIAKGRLA